MGEHLKVSKFPSRKEKQVMFSLSRTVAIGVLFVGSVQATKENPLVTYLRQDGDADASCAADLYKDVKKMGAFNQFVDEVSRVELGKLLYAFQESEDHKHLVDKDLKQAFARKEVDNLLFKQFEDFENALGEFTASPDAVRVFLDWVSITDLRRLVLELFETDMCQLLGEMSATNLRTLLSRCRPDWRYLKKIVREDKTNGHLGRRNKFFGVL